MKSNIFTCAKSQATASRVIIDKLLVRCTSKVKELQELEDERAEDESEDEYSEGLRKELAEDNNKIKAQMEIHREKSNQLGLMANYILECSSNVPI